jgi:hypothetical protein
MEMKSRIWFMIVGLALITTLAAPAVSQTPAYLVGTVLSIRDENSMYVNFMQSNIPGMQGTTLILLPRPVTMRNLLYFQGKVLTFSLLGHDILGRPICDAYYNGIPLDYFTNTRYPSDYYADTRYPSNYYADTRYSSNYYADTQYSSNYVINNGYSGTTSSMNY